MFYTFAPVDKSSTVRLILVVAFTFVVQAYQPGVSVYNMQPTPGYTLPPGMFETSIYSQMMIGRVMH